MVEGMNLGRTRRWWWGLTALGVVVVGGWYVLVRWTDEREIARLSAALDAETAAWAERAAARPRPLLFGEPVEGDPFDYYRQALKRVPELAACDPDRDAEIFDLISMGARATGPLRPAESWNGRPCVVLIGRSGYKAGGLHPRPGREETRWTTDY